MNNRLISILFAVTVSLIAQPSFAWCGYTDTFYIANPAPYGLHISSVSDDRNAIGIQLNRDAFQIKDADNCPAEGGNVTVALTSNNGSTCTLRIHDGEAEMDPRVNAACNGIQYNGMQYDGFMTYRYSLHFSALSR